MSTELRPITAILYADGQAFETFLRDLTAGMVRRGLRLAGLVQHSIPRPDRRKCDMLLRDLATGALHPISEDRGAEAHGCSLDTDLLTRACTAAEVGLSDRTALLVLCKFGKVEAGGGGMRGLIEAALGYAVPVLIGVPAINREAFEAFAGDFAHLLPLELFGPDAIDRIIAGQLA
ncbi:conserved hypothetical protein [Hyphomicrobiales bacterium]|nr:conserved hypothetical protein [Hyphomicrobiales bacterium]CAH1691672.1 conserved hypothetical protein [Hyphomicrobiales bacterium]